MPASPEERAAIVELYASGLTAYEVAAEIGRSYAHVYHALDEAGVPFHRHRKKRPGSPTSGRKPWLR